MEKLGIIEGEETEKVSSPVFYMGIWRKTEKGKCMEPTSFEGDAVDRILQGPKRYVNLCIVGVNVLVFLLVELTGSSENTEHMVNWGAAWLPYILDGQYFRLFTCMFLHFGIYHLGNNMIVLLFLGDTLEQLTGHLKYGLICLGGGLIGSIASGMHAYISGDYYVSAGASGCVFAVTGALLYIVLRERGRIGTLTVRKMVVLAVLSVYNGVVSVGVDNYAHVGGLIGGFVLCALFCRKKISTEWGAES